MKYPYIVNHNGIWYPAGADVPVGIPHEVKSEKPTRTEIQQMRKSDLVALAAESGIADADGMTGNELKAALLELFGV